MSQYAVPLRAGLPPAQGWAGALHSLDGVCRPGDRRGGATRRSRSGSDDIDASEPDEVPTVGLVLRERLDLTVFICKDRSAYCCCDERSSCCRRSVKARCAASSSVSLLSWASNKVNVASVDGVGGAGATGDVTATLGVRYAVKAPRSVDERLEGLPAVVAAAGGEGRDDTDELEAPLAGRAVDDGGTGAFIEGLGFFDLREVRGGTSPSTSSSKREAWGHRNGCGVGCTNHTCPTCAFTRGERAFRCWDRGRRRNAHSGHCWSTAFNLFNHDGVHTQPLQTPRSCGESWANHLHVNNHCKP